AHLLDRLERRDDPERAVVLAPLRDSVEMRAGPDVVPPGGAADEVPIPIDVDREPRLTHPTGSELERLVLLRAGGNPVRAGPAADRVELLEPREHPLR